MIKPSRTDIKTLELRVLRYWVGDLGEVVLVEYFFGRVGVFREAWKLVGRGEREVGG